MDSVTAHFISALVIVSGALLVILGHATLYAAKGAVVTWGIYRYVKHPQYLGIMIIAGGMLVEYPTVPSFVMWVILACLYLVKARQESREIAIVLSGK